MSNSDVVIRVEGLGKKYSLHHQTTERYTALRDVLGLKAKSAVRLLNPFTLAGQLRKAQRQSELERVNSDEEFWALKDVSFEIRRGERVGIIGCNGAGKSTLLKILSRITEPTTGRVEIRGRVASLLEVGTGFHPELTGRENIFLNGAILGMSQREVRSRFDEIVDFAEVEKFLDTPVKRYSSGMYVRLAFAVAAHLEPDILVVDEVLAVGDAGFQKKCLGKMEDVSEREGRTLLFVSHQMQAISRLCDRAVLLVGGTVSSIGDIQTVFSRYSSLSFSTNRTKEYRTEDRPGDNRASLMSCWIEDKDGNPISEAALDQAIFINMVYKIHDQTHGTPYPNLHVYNAYGDYIFVLHGSVVPEATPLNSCFQATFIIPENFLNNGTYIFGLALTFTIGGTHVSFFQENELSISMHEELVGSSMRINSGYYGPIPGSIRPALWVKIAPLHDLY